MLVGIVGEFLGNILDCHNFNLIIGHSYVGGVSGTASGGVIQKCSNLGKVTGITSIGRYYTVVVAIIIME